MALAAWSRPANLAKFIRTRTLTRGRVRMSSIRSKLGLPLAIHLPQQHMKGRLKHAQH